MSILKKAVNLNKATSYGTESSISDARLEVAELVSDIGIESSMVNSDISELNGSIETASLLDGFVVAVGTESDLPDDELHKGIGALEAIAISLGIEDENNDEETTKETLGDKAKKMAAAAWDAIKQLIKSIVKTIGGLGKKLIGLFTSAKKAAETISKRAGELDSDAVAANETVKVKRGVELGFSGYLAGTIKDKGNLVTNNDAASVTKDTATPLYHAIKHLNAVISKAINDDSTVDLTKVWSDEEHVNVGDKGVPILGDTSIEFRNGNEQTEVKFESNKSIARVMTIDELKALPELLSVNASFTEFFKSLDFDNPKEDSDNVTEYSSLIQLFNESTNSVIKYLSKYAAYVVEVGNSSLAEYK